MQLIVTFHADELVLPMAHRHLQQAMIYSAIRQSDPVHAAHLHEQGREADERKFKLFTFGPLQGDYMLENGCICFYGDVRFEIRSADPYMLSMLVLMWRPGTAVQMGNNALTVVDCQLKNHVVSEERICVRTRAPIVAYITQEDKRTVFYSPRDPQFYTMLATNAGRKWRSFTGEESAPDFSCTIVEGGAVKKQVTKFKNTRINAWFGAFELTGEPRMLNLLYHTGLGAKSSQGFGMFDLVESV